MDDHQKELQKRMLEQACKINEERCLKNPTDVDNLATWGGALLELSQFGTLNESKHVLREAISKLKEALTINPAKHEAIWCLATAYITNAFLVSNYDEAQDLFDTAFLCFRQAVDESPETEHYIHSLAIFAEVRKLHKDNFTQAGLGETQQTLGGGPTESSRVTRSAKNKSSDLKYDICGWVILAVGIVIWIGMAQSRMPPPPAR